MIRVAAEYLGLSFLPIVLIPMWNRWSETPGLLGVNPAAGTFALVSCSYRCNALTERNRVVKL